MSPGLLMAADARTVAQSVRAARLTDSDANTRRTVEVRVRDGRTGWGQELSSEAREAV
jgi:hypothetical protein